MLCSSRNCWAILTKGEGTQESRPVTRPLEYLGHASEAVAYLFTHKSSLVRMHGARPDQNGVHSAGVLGINLLSSAAGHLFAAIHGPQVRGENAHTSPSIASNPRRTDALTSTVNPRQGGVLYRCPKYELDSCAAANSAIE